MKHCIVTITITALLLVACGGAAAPAAPSAPAVYGTLIGYDEVTTGNHVADIDINDVPSGKYPFHAIATLHEGTRVQILGHDENDAMVLTPDGRQGYVGIDSIKELKP